MSPRNSYYLKLACWIVASLTAVAVVQSNVVIAVLTMIACVVFGSRFLRRLDCPRCGSSIALYSSAAGLPLSHCSVCELDLRLPFKGKPYDEAM